MSMKSTGPTRASCSWSVSNGMPSTGGTPAALSTTATMSTRARTPATVRSAGRCDCRAVPPAPMTAPRYRCTSGEAGVGITLVLERVGERRGVPLVHQQQHHEEQAHRHRLGPQERRDMARDRRGAEQQEADVLAEPAAQRQQDLLPLAVLLPERRRYVPSSRSAGPQQPDQLDRAREQLLLPHDVIAVHPRAEALQHRAGGSRLQIFREIELARLPHAPIEE